MALFPLNTSILLEAKKKNTNKIIKVNPEESDYDTMVDEDEDTGIETTDDGDISDTSNEIEGDDYTQYNDDTDSSDQDDVADDSDSTDYSKMDDETSSASDDIDSDTDYADDQQDTSTDDEEATDYGVDDFSDEDDSESTSEDDDSGDYSDDDRRSDDESSISKDIVSTDPEKNKLLIQDFLNLYYFSKNILEKLSVVDKGDMVVNSIISQVTHNITLLRSKLYDYIVHSFSEKYIHNLYQYNLFIQGMNINIEMLKKIKDFNVN